jgi:hypothetical protein
MSKSNKNEGKNKLNIVYQKNLKVDFETRKEFWKKVDTLQLNVLFCFFKSGLIIFS